MNKSVCVIGAGVSGIFAAINQKRNHPNDDVFIIEHTDIALRKLLATGNGRCNLGNENIDINRFSNKEFVTKIMRDYSFETYKEYFSNLNIITKSINELLYPVSETAQTVRNILLNEINRLGIKIFYGENIQNYEVNNTIIVRTDKSSFECDKLIIATGGKSLPNSGSDGSIFPIFVNHKYYGKNCKPGLCPIYTKENTKKLDGLRIKSNVKLYGNNELIHEEKGEVLFKKHGLSGIVIMNISSIIGRDISKDYKLVIDFLPDFDKNTLEKMMQKMGKNEFLYAYLHPLFVDYFKAKNSPEIIDNVKKCEFTFEGLYTFENSQITVGGIDVNEVNENLESIHEKNVYFVGEVLDVDGPCGGYNLTWAIWSSLVATK